MAVTNTLSKKYRLLNYFNKKFKVPGLVFQVDKHALIESNTPAYLRKG